MLSRGSSTLKIKYEKGFSKSALKRRVHCILIRVVFHQGLHCTASCAGRAHHHASYFCRLYDWTVQSKNWTDTTVHLKKVDPGWKSPWRWFFIIQNNISLFPFFFTTVLSQLDFSHRKFGLPSLGKASCARVELPNLRCMLGVLVFPSSTKLWHGLRDL